MTGIRFRVIENKEKLFDTAPIPVRIPKRVVGIEEFIETTYNKLKKEYPNAEIVVICEHIIWETYEPMTKLLPEDILGLIKKVDETMKEGIL